MSRFVLLGLLPLAVAAPAAAQTMDHSMMPGMAMPAAPAMPASPPADPHAMPPPKPAMDHSTMPGMSMPDQAADPPASPMPAMAQPESPKPPLTDHAADRFFPPTAMAAARRQLTREHGATPQSMFMTNLAEYQARSGGYRWDGQAWFGGDVHRLVLKSEGEGTRGEGVESAELQALYSRAIGVYTDLQAGVRQDVAPYGRTYATVGFETLAPYWIDVEGAAFLSTKGEVLARLEGTYDLRLTQRWILQPRAEFNFAAQNTPETRTGSGLSTAELGLRLRYEVRREFAPYVGLSWERKAGKTADYARARGEDVETTSLVVGVRAFF